MLPETVRWEKRVLRIIDQTLLPGELKYIELASAEAVWEAIRSLRVRGAPAIGVCAAYGVLVGVLERVPVSSGELLTRLEETTAYLATARPTAVNLFWALDRMKQVQAAGDVAATLDAIEAEAVAIHEEDRLLCRAIGEEGAGLIKPGDGVLTHCNAGSLATSYHGTALSIMYSAHYRGTPFEVYADETRPLLQGARLTAWELMQAGIPVTLICDSTAAQVMREGRVQLVVVGADRIAANGDVANKVGTYGVAVLAKAHGIPFYVAAPYSTFDLSLSSGEAIPIEQRPPEEVTHGFGTVVAPEGVAVYAPAFDVTPAGLISGIVTERGILEPPFERSIQELLAAPLAREMD